MGLRTAATEKNAIAAVQKHGALLVYPIVNRREPLSLWSVLHPGVEMRWAWDEGADSRVVDLWHLRAQLAQSRSLAYGKWYKGRAVFFSHELFGALLALSRVQPLYLSEESREILKLLEDDSPQSSKALRQAAGLSGRHNERIWNKAMTALWELLLIVGTGEIEDGAFPSLAVGATRWIFEEIWDAAAGEPSAAQLALIAKHMPTQGPFGKHLRKVMAASAEALVNRSP